MSFGLPKKFDEYRQSFQGHYGDEQNGFIRLPQKGLAIQFSNGGGWEHVSISRKSKMPSYDDLVWARQIFWGGNTTVMQLFVPAEDHVNVHPYCLHLWRPMEGEIPRPPRWMLA